MKNKLRVIVEWKIGSISGGETKAFLFVQRY